MTRAAIPLRIVLARQLGALTAAASITVLALGTGANAPTAGFLYLLAVLALATWGGLAAGVTGSLASSVAYNYFFFPPHGTLTVADPANWVALLTFLAAATLTSRLVARARAEAADAERRRREIESLYELLFGLFAAAPGPGQLGAATGRALRALGATDGALVLRDPTNGPARVVATIGAPTDLLAAVDQRTAQLSAPLPSADERAIPLTAGGDHRGLLLVRGAVASREMEESAGRLLALAAERERLLAETARGEAIRASDALKTALLRAVSHDLRTPLTSLHLELEGLTGALPTATPDLGRRLATLRRELNRLTRRIDNLLAMARLEAGTARAHPEPVPPGELFHAAREAVAALLADRVLRVHVEPDCPDCLADSPLAVEVLANLLENAARASPGDAPIELIARPDDVAQRVAIEVHDRGPGVPSAVRKRLGDAPARATANLGGSPTEGDDRGAGLGLEIALGLARAQAGAIELVDRPGGGTIARLTLPAAAAADDQLAR